MVNSPYTHLRKWSSTSCRLHQAARGGVCHTGALIDRHAGALGTGRGHCVLSARQLTVQRPIEVVERRNKFLLTLGVERGRQEM
jgi:hypothetical protein